LPLHEPLSFALRLPYRYFTPRLAWGRYLGAR
jgi:hypothetical protein